MFSLSAAKTILRIATELGRSILMFPTGGARPPPRSPRPPACRSSAGAGVPFSRRGQHPAGAATPTAADSLRLRQLKPEADTARPEHGRVDVEIEPLRYLCKFIYTVVESYKLDIS